MNNRKKIIHIDLTEDDGDSCNKKKKMMKKRKELLWLKKLMNDDKNKKKSINNCVEIVDAHSTENFDNIDKKNEYDTSLKDVFLTTNIDDNNCQINMCPVSTTVSAISTDEISIEPPICWNDANLFESTDYYELDFFIDNDYQQNQMNKITENNQQIKIDKFSNDETTNIQIEENIFSDNHQKHLNDTIIIDSQVKKNTTNWNYLFDFHLANIESTGNSVLSDESQLLVDPKLINKNTPNIKQNYLSCLGLNHKQNDIFAEEQIDMNNLQTNYCQSTNDNDLKNIKYNIEDVPSTSRDSNKIENNNFSLSNVTSTTNCTTTSRFAVNNINEDSSLKKFKKSSMKIIKNQNIQHSIVKGILLCSKIFFKFILLPFII